MSILTNALERTRYQLGGWRSAYLLIFVGLVSLGVHGVMWGFPQMVAEWQPYTSAVIGWFAAATVLLAYNLCSAPYRIEKDHGDAIARRNSELREQIDTQTEQLAKAKSEIADLKSLAPKLVFDLPTIVGTIGEKSSTIGMIVRLRNVGPMPSATYGWGMIVHLPDGTKENVRIVPLEEAKTIQMPNDSRPFTFEPTEQMMIKAAEPIPPGKIVEGILIGEVAVTDLFGCKVEVGCFDVHEKHIVGYFPIEGVRHDKMPWSPHLNVKWGEVPGE